MFLKNIFRRQFFRYAIVGAFSTAINYSVFYILFQFLHINYIAAAAIGFFTGVMLSYFFNRTWTFESTVKSRSAVLKYYFVYTISLLISLMSLKMGVNIMNMDVRIANIAAIGITTSINFFGTKFFVFNSVN